MLRFASEQKTFVTLDELAEPYSQHIAEHIRYADRQATRPTGPFLDACRKLARGELSAEKMRGITVSRGFQNVIDAFHTVNREPIPIRFFVDEREAKKGITITDELLQLVGSSQFENLAPEVEARWRLVETAWDLEMSRALLRVRFNDLDQRFVVGHGERRRDVTSSRDALNGYQKGKCFYCFSTISVVPGTLQLGEVDHFFAWSLTRDKNLVENLNGIWNLVLACESCNRGGNGKHARVPRMRYLERLERRNNFLIASHHPLRETLMSQTGSTEAGRASFLRDRDREAIDRLIHRWSPIFEEATAF